MKNFEESVALIKLLAISSNEYHEGRHCSSDKLKDRLAAKFEQYSKISKEEKELRDKFVEMIAEYPEDKVKLELITSSEVIEAFKGVK